MAFHFHVAIMLCVAVSMILSQQCDESFDSTDCIYDVYCNSNNLRSLYPNQDGRFQINEEYSTCKYHRVYYDGSLFMPINLIYKETEMGLSELIFGNEQTRHTIVALNLSNNEFNQVPNIGEMTNLEFLDISHNFLETAKLSDTNELPLTKIDLSHNTINKIEIFSNEHSYNKLKTINLCHNYLVGIPDAIFDNFRELETLDISHNFIDTLTILTFEGAKELLHLNMSHNRIADIASSLFRFNKLITLKVNNNKLELVKRSDFKNLYNLNTLDLSFNLIEFVDPNAFDDLASLVTLDLSNNQIKTISKQTISNLNNLKEINLSQNFLKELPLGMFKGKAVASIFIEVNLLTGSLVRGTFEGLQYVSQLDLSNQHLTSIEDYAFFGLEKVQKILLNNNNIQSLSINSFRTLQHLLELDLSNNMITNIDFNKEDLLSLQTLSLRNNQITHVKYEYLHSLKLLQFLDLSYNNISHLETDSFKSLKELINFQISNNPLSGALEENTFEGLNSLPSLDISRSMMTAICNNSFLSMVQLRDLNISFSKIEDLQYNAFRKTGAIQMIDLSFNQLNVFNINTTELAGLRTLLLNGNLLSTVGRDTFRGLKSLMKVSLSNNNILNFDDDAFTNLLDLRYLDLSYNPHLNFNVTFIRMNTNLKSLYLLGITSGITFTQVSNIPISTLDISNAKLTETLQLKLQELTHLETLVLNNNDIIRLQVESFVKVKTIRNLDLSFNKISFMQPGTFKDNTLLHSLNLSHNALTTIGYGVFRGLIYLHTLDISFNNINSLQTERFYEVTSLSILLADHNKISTVNAEDFIGTSLSTLSIGENPIPCELFVNLKKKNLPFEITATRLDDKSDAENIDGVTCNVNQDSHTPFLNASSSGVNNKILIDIKNILLKISNTENKTTKTMPLSSETRLGEDISNQLLSISNRIETSLTNTTSRIESNIENIASKLVNAFNISNSLMGKILKVLSVNRQIIYTPSKENRSEPLLSFIEEVKADLEKTIAVEKERVDEISEKIAAINSKIYSTPTLDAPKHEKYVASDVSTQTESLFTKTCLALILSLLVCIILYKFYKSRLFVRHRLSISTRELPSAMEHSAL